MRRLRTIAIATSAALATICCTAAAKEIDTVSICGADGCRAVADERLLALLADAGLPHRGAVAPAEHFVARVRVVHEGAEAYRFKTIVLPDAGLVRSEDGGWGELPYAAQGAYAKLTRGRDPLPASAMPRELAPPPKAAASTQGEDASAWLWPWLAAAAGVLLLGGLVLMLRRGRSSVLTAGQ